MQMKAAVYCWTKLPWHDKLLSVPEQV